MSEEMDLTNFPSSPKKAVEAIALQIAASLLPFGSGAAGVLLSALMPELNNDRVAWLEYLGASLLQHAQRLRALEEKALDVGELVQHPEFRAAVLRTTDIALRDPLRKKWRALSNAVLNIAAGEEQDDNLQQTFLGYIADLMALHLILLDCIADPLAWAKMRDYPVYDGPEQVDAGAVFEGACRAELQV